MRSRRTERTPGRALGGQGCVHGHRGGWCLGDPGLQAKRGPNTLGLERRCQRNQELIACARLDLLEIGVYAGRVDGEQPRIQRPGITAGNQDGAPLRGALGRHRAEIEELRCDLEADEDLSFADQGYSRMIRVVRRDDDVSREIAVELAAAERDGQLLRRAWLDRTVGPTVESDPSTASRVDPQVGGALVADVEGEGGVGLPAPHGLCSDRLLVAAPPGARDRRKCGVPATGDDLLSRGR